MALSGQLILDKAIAVIIHILL